MIIKRIKKQLEIQKKNNLYRRPFNISKRENKFLYIQGDCYLNFASNDYLGLAASTSFHKYISKYLERFGSSSSSSRLMTGNLEITNQAEKEYANYFGFEDALFFPSGYQANIGIISSLFNQNDHIIFDKHLHSSLITGIKLSAGKISGYKHNRLGHLEEKIKAQIEDEELDSTVVVAESLYSMDGDLLDVSSLESLKKKYGFFCVVDEAHSFGVLGAHGVGIAKKVSDVSIGTFGKALGYHGAFVLLPKLVKEFLINFCSPLIYTTAIAPYSAEVSMKILEKIQSMDSCRKYLNDLSRFTRDLLQKNGIKFQGEAHIISIVIGNEKKCLQTVNLLKKNKIIVGLARFPTVPKNKALIRIGLTALHAETDVIKLVNILKENNEVAEE